MQKLYFNTLDVDIEAMPISCIYSIVYHLLYAHGYYLIMIELY